MKRITALFILVFSTFCLHAQTLSWDIKFLKGRIRESIPISQIIRMEKGDVFLIAITPESDCFCYVLNYDSERKIFIFYDEPIKKAETLNIGPLQIDDPPGTETLYLIISQTKQIALENHIKDYRNNPDSRRYANNVYHEVVRLQNAITALGEPGSSFIPSGGTTRGETQEYTTRFSGKNTYVRTITIRH